MRFPSEEALLARVERVRSTNPKSVELVDAIFAYLETQWFEPVKTESLINEAAQIAEELGYRIGWAKVQTARAGATYIRTRYEESLPLIAGVIPVLIEHDAQREYAWCLLLLSAVAQSTGAYDASLQHAFKAIGIAKRAGATEAEAWLSYRVADTYRELGDREQMLEYAQACHELFETLYSKTGLKQHLIGTGRARTQLAMAHELSGRLDDALEFNKAALERYELCGDSLGISRAITDIGRVFDEMGDHERAEEYLTRGLELRRTLGHRASQTSNLLALGKLYSGRGDTDMAISSFEEALEIATEANVKMRAYQAHEALAGIYEATGETEKALGHFRAFHELKEEVAGEAMRLRIHNAKMMADIARAEQEAEFERSRSEELDSKNRELAALLEELRSTQDRLVHSEKMASLGQLTAGIAHEIRNPLNFVNNFSELSGEIVSEMSDVLNRCSSRLPDEQREDMAESLETLRFNTSKIREHGARADSIVKSMLQHSRSRPGEHAPADLNNLLEEYVNLAYHGMRARNTDFNVTLDLDYDEDVGEVSCIAQDIGRVFLNLISNAFDAMHDHTYEGAPGPTLSVSSRRLGDDVVVRIGDNGPGIPAVVKSRIFEPFFTTKPTGSGTGLGLSMSYDIVTKGHGGQIELESSPGEGAVFVVTLPG